MSHEVVAALIIQSQMILLGLRSATRAFYPNVWELLGGHTEPGEQFAHPTYPILFARYLASNPKP